MTLLTVRLAVPVLLSVMGVLELVEPTTTPLKLMPMGERVAMGATPVPPMVTLCGLPDTLSETFTAEERFPVLVGLNTTLMVQLAFTARDDGQVVVSEKSVVLPLEILMPVTVSEAVPVFVRVITCAELFTPTCWLPKVKLVGDKLTTGCAAANAGNENTARTETLQRSFDIRGFAWQYSSGGCSMFLLFCANRGSKIQTA